MNSSSGEVLEVGVRYYPSSLFWVILINTLFFSGYIILKDPLAYILYSQGMSLDQAYSITTTANLLLSFCALFFGSVMRDCLSQKQALLASITLCTLSLALLECHILKWTLFAINCYVLGGGLYFFNILIFINRLCQGEQARIQGNYYYRIFTNLGAVLGMVILINQIQTQHAFRASLVLSAASLVLMIFSYPMISETASPSTVKSLFKFYSLLLLLFGLLYFAFLFQSQARIMVIGLFLIGVFYSLYYSITTNNTQFTALIGLILILNIPYWLASTIFLTGFFYFLKLDVSPIFNQISSSYLTLTDPIVNVLVGVAFLFFQNKNPMTPYRNLAIGSFALLLSFLILTLGLGLVHSGQKISSIYPLLALMAFSTAEFLLQTNLNARIRTCLAETPNGEFYATGIMRSTRAFSTALAYYFIVGVALHHASIASDLHRYFHLFLTLFCICGLSFFFLIIFRTFFFSHERVA